jgi:hypothetical protein
MRRRGNIHQPVSRIIPASVYARPGPRDRQAPNRHRNHSRYPQRGRAGECLRCHTLFATGVDTDRRADAKFCSDKCRITRNSLRRSL